MSQITFSFIGIDREMFNVDGTLLNYTIIKLGVTYFIKQVSRYLKFVLNVFKFRKT